MEGMDWAEGVLTLSNAPLGAGDQDGCGGFEGAGQGFDDVEGGALAAELDDGDVVAGEAGFEGELFLGQVLFEAALADGFSECLLEFFGRHGVAGLLEVAFGGSSNYRWNVQAAGCTDV